MFYLYYKKEKKKTMKKIFMSAILLSMIVLATGCTTTKSYTFKVETGDNIEVKLDASDGYDITSDLPFTISKDGEDLSQGTFITLDGYDYYITGVNNNSDAKIIDSGTKNGLEYTFYSYDSEYNYIIKVKDSNTGLVIGNIVSEESAKECFDRLTITKK